MQFQPRNSVLIYSVYLVFMLLPFYLPAKILYGGISLIPYLLTTIGFLYFTMIRGKFLYKVKLEWSDIFYFGFFTYTIIIIIAFTGIRESELILTHIYKYLIGVTIYFIARFELGKIDFRNVINIYFYTATIVALLYVVEWVFGLATF